MKNSKFCRVCGSPIELYSDHCYKCNEPIIETQNINQQQYPQQSIDQQQYPQQSIDQQQYPQKQFMQQPNMQYPNMHQTIIIQQPNNSDPVNQYWPIKSKITAGVLGIFLGGIGIHKFYMGRVGLGILYILFCWTYLPAIIGFIEGIVYLASSDYNFQIKHQVRII